MLYFYKKERKPIMLWNYCHIVSKLLLELEKSLRTPLEIAPLTYLIGQDGIFVILHVDGD